MQNAARVETLIHIGEPFTLMTGTLSVQVNRVVRYLGKGDYNEAYLVDTDSGPRVLKIPGERMKNMTNKGVSEMLSTLLLVYKQFKPILQNEIYAGRVAEFEDLNPYLDVENANITPEWAAQNLTAGFHLVEYIPHDYPVEPNTGSLDPGKSDYSEAREADTQLAHMFRAAAGAYPPLQNRRGEALSIDLQYNNVKMDDDGILVLIDPAMPTGDESFLTMKRKFLASFAPEGSTRSDFLDPASG